MPVTDFNIKRDWKLLAIVGGILLPGMILAAWIGLARSEEYSHINNLAKTLCTDKQFYFANFERCEGFNIRPQGIVP